MFIRYLNIDIVLDMNRFESVIEDCDLIITGEGRFDAQSLAGKVPVGVAKRAKSLNKPVIVIAGDVGENTQSAYDSGITAVFSTNRRAVPFEQARLTCREDMYSTANAVARLLKKFIYTLIVVLVVLVVVFVIEILVVGIDVFKIVLAIYIVVFVLVLVLVHSFFLRQLLKGNIQFF